ATRSLEEVPDLDVTFIGRTPRYEKYHMEKQADNQYLLKPGTELWQRWPEANELVTFTAQITNQGEAMSGDFDFTWQVDGVEVASGTSSNLNPGSYTYQDYHWRWQDGVHQIKFKVDPDQDINEVSETNNLLEERTNSLALIFHLEESFCLAFDQVENKSGSYSCEDWLQYQISILNQKLEDSVYDTAPTGANVRVRIDNIYIHQDGEIDNLTGTQDWGYDGSWNIAWDSGDGSCLDRGIWCADQDYVNTYKKAVDWNLLNNLAQNMLGLADLSLLSVYTSDVHLTDSEGLVTDSADLPEVAEGYVYQNRHRGLLNSLSQHYFSEYSVLALNRFSDFHLNGDGDKRGLPKRRGYTGDFLKDIPAINKIKVLDKYGNPLPGVGIAVYQESAYGFADQIKYSGGTDGSGYWTFPGQTTSTYWGLRMSTRNPFSSAKLTDKTAGISAGYLTAPYPGVSMYDAGLIIRLASQGQYEYHFLDITAFNLAFWQGDYDQAVYSLDTNFPPFTVDNFLVSGTKAGGGPQVRVFNQYGNLVRQFMAFEDDFRGGINVAQADVDGDGQNEIIVSSGPGRSGQVRVFSSQGIYQNSFTAFDLGFSGGVSIASGNLDGGTASEIVVAPMSEGGPNVRIFGYRDGQYLPTTENFLAYEANFRGGISVAVGDLEGDGLAEIITAPISQGGPHLRIFGYRDGVYQPVILGLMAYSESFRGGINLATGDLNGDGSDEIITGVISQGGPHVRVFGRNRQRTISLLNPGFMAYNQSFSGGISVASTDLDADGRAEIVAGINSQDVATVRVYDWQGKMLLNEFISYPDSYTGGVNLSGGSI
ncbi:hypothetical protein KKI23_04410, partial [Patescibacteria group bacterium]|nr:hypothetical protein [Patescibacteria group bacterium]